MLAPEDRRLHGDPLMVAEVEARLMEGRPKLHTLGEFFEQRAVRESTRRRRLGRGFTVEGQ